MARRTRLTAACLDVLFPPRCALCRRRGWWVCPDCRPIIVRLTPPSCARCGVPTALASCQCANLPPEIAMHRAVAAYGGWLRPAILSFKYGGERARAAHLAAELVELLPDVGPLDALIAVPLHPKRTRERGYNQSECLAKEMQRLTGLPVLHAVRRVRATPHQVGLNGAERMANVAGAFALNDGLVIAGLRVALIDDVYTTGSTLGACASALALGNPKAIITLTLARELDDTQADAT